MSKPTTATSIQPPLRRPLTCPECDGAREYPYHPDETGEVPPYAHNSPVGTGWHDGFWWKRCWLCGGTGEAS